MAPETKIELTDAVEEHRWLREVVVAIAEEKWGDAELLIMTRRAETAQLGSLLMQERRLCLNDWELRLQDLPTKDRVELQMGMRRLTFQPITEWLRSEWFSSFRRFLHVFMIISIKLVVALFCAAVGAAVHHIVAARIEHQFERWLWQYFGLVAFVLFYSAVEKSVEGLFEKRILAVKKWSLRAEATAEAVNAVLAQQRLDEMRAFHTKYAKPKDAPTAE